VKLRGRGEVQVLLAAIAGIAWQPEASAKAAINRRVENVMMFSRSDGGSLEHSRFPDVLDVALLMYS
jgi:hypothetical protein